MLEVPLELSKCPICKSHMRRHLNDLMLLSVCAHKQNECLCQGTWAPADLCLQQCAVADKQYYNLSGEVLGKKRKGR